MSAFRAHSLRSKTTVVLAVLLASALASPNSAFAGNKKKTTTDTTAADRRTDRRFVQDRHFASWRGRSRLPFREFVTRPTLRG